MKTSRKKCYELFGAALACLLGGISPAFAKSVAGPVVLVRDIVRSCHGSICDLEVCAAPGPGLSRVVSERDVLRAFEDAGLAVGDLDIPKRIRFTRKVKNSSSSELKALVSEAIDKVLLDGLVVESLGTMGELKVPEEGYEVRARWPGERVFRRHLSFPVELISAGQVFRTLQVAAVLAMDVRLPVATTDLALGEVIRPEQILFETVRLKETPTELAVEADEVIGRRLVRNIGTGEPFSKRDVERIPIISRGQRVSVEANQGLISIRATGVAHGDGAVGDRIRVLVQPAGRVFSTMVIAPGRTKVIP